MADLKGFDATKVEPSAGREPLPAGKYLAAVTHSEMRPTKAGTGRYLQLTFTVLEGPFKGRQLWARLNLINSNPQAAEIAMAELSAVCRAVGVLAPNDSAELHDLPLVVTVACRKREDTGGITNEITGYAKREGAGVAPHTNGAAPADHLVPPWQRG